VLYPDFETNSYWENWLLQNPGKSETVAAAKVAILELQFQEKEPDAVRVQEIWEAITKANQSLVTAEESEGVPPQAEAQVIKLPLWQQWSKIAAAILLLIGFTVSFLIYRNLNSQTELTTAFGETKTILLPDNSKVILNANSRIVYQKSWDADEKREIWLEGEAFFKVVHTKSNQKFIVHTSDKVNVEVLGTMFDVLRRKDKTRIVLSSGKVKLNIGKAEQQQEVYMTPGDLIELKKETLKIKKERVNPEQFSSWTQNKLYFDGTPLDELIILLEENYGLQVMVADSALLQKKLWGSLPSNDVELLLTAMSNTFDLDIRRTGEQVQISDKK
jgi:ferric-dicitrate binding protein FerR (iron transport regulator)